MDCMPFGVRPSKTFSIHPTEICLHALYWECREEYGECCNFETHHPVKAQARRREPHSANRQMDSARNWGRRASFTDEKEDSRRCRLNLT